MSLFSAIIGAAKPASAAAPTPVSISMSGAGVTFPYLDGTYPRLGVTNGRSFYGGQTIDEEGNIWIRWTGSQWEVKDIGSTGDVFYTSNSDVAEPHLATWSVGPDGTGPVPTFTPTY